MNQSHRPTGILNCGIAKQRKELVRFTYQCPKNWSDLGTTSDSSIRSCEVCQQNVYYCTDKQEAEQHARQGHCIAVDSKLTSQVDNQYRDPMPMVMGRPKPKYSGEPTSTRAWAKDLFNHSKHQLAETIKNQEMKAIDLNHVDLSHVDLKGVDLGYADLSGVNLTNTNLSHANLSYANLEGAKLHRTNLSHANLSGVDLSSIFRNCRDFNLDGAILEPEFKTQYLQYLLYKFPRSKQQALEVSQQVLSIRREIGDLAGEADTLQKLGKIYLELGDSQQFAECFRQALSIKRDIGDCEASRRHRSGEAQVLKCLGDVDLESQNYPQALDTYQQALLISREVKDSFGEAQILDRLSNLYFQQNDRQKAAEHYQLALAIFARLNKTEETISVLKALIEIYQNSELESDLHLLIEYYQKLLDIEFSDRNNRRKIEILDKLGDLYLKLSDKQQALEYYQQRLVLIQNTSDRQSEIITLKKIIKICDRLLDNRLLLEYYQQLLVIYRQKNDRFKLKKSQRFDEALTLGDMGTVYHRLGKPNRALDCYNRAFSFIKQLENVDGVKATLFSLIGKIYKDLERPQQALDYYRQALTLRQKNGDRLGAIRVSKHIEKLVEDIN